LPIINTVEERSFRRVVERKADMSQEKSSHANLQSALLVGPFTPEEAARLRSIRTHLLNNPQYLDRVLDEHRLRFVRYLMEQGEISDDQA